MTCQPLLAFDLPTPVESARSHGHAEAERAASRASRIRPGWRQSALDAVRAYAESHERFMAEDVRIFIDLPAEADARALGAIMCDARRAGIVKADGYAPARSSNGTPKVRWRSLVRVGA
jgi:hypothetical protein